MNTPGPRARQQTARMKANYTDTESRIEPRQLSHDHQTVAALVGRAWTQTNLTQSQFGLYLMRLASGYSEAPEMETAGLASGDSIAVPTDDLLTVLTAVEEELANGRFSTDPRLHMAVDSLRSVFEESDG